MALSNLAESAGLKSKPKHRGKRYRGHHKQRQLPEIAAPLQPWPSERLDDLDQHDADDDKGEQFRHAAFEQHRWRLSKLFLRHLRGQAFLTEIGLIPTLREGAAPPSSATCQAPDRLLSGGVCDTLPIKKRGVRS
ncbi:hypothetical protein P9273_26715 [Mesorhizobium sp. WSM4935]|uniref:hypothetical protein n=1 Tax=Mesorhizobium sp. WSM4935 TaxID=3038547 RepID=UPI002415560A|nr:hypothetical protein [Mesorhizobium sp. WSM4935]MDG4878674.1 hypothetical protein [Mesorhizobium sp. WSM4935]